MQSIKLDDALSESEALAKIRTIADKNKVRFVLCWAGLDWTTTGMYQTLAQDHCVPHVSARGWSQHMIDILGTVIVVET